jgi:hypothetical protein
LVPELLEKKTGAGAAWGKNQEPETLKNLPAPQPWSVWIQMIDIEKAAIRFFLFCRILL